ncbi:hypothetical protein MASR2M44_13910 [Bacteroidota bacterium]
MIAFCRQFELNHEVCGKIVVASNDREIGFLENLAQRGQQNGLEGLKYLTKAVNEYYADVFSKVYGFHTIGLRYFNVFGPKQNPNNPYAAVIPIFCKHFIEGSQPTINGDGLTSRDFTFVENAVQANIRALLFESLTKHEVFNTACGDQVTLNEMVEMLKRISELDITAIYGPERAGDVKHSKASIEKIMQLLSYDPKFRFNEGLKIVFNWYKSV